MDKIGKTKALMYFLDELNGFLMKTVGCGSGNMASLIVLVHRVEEGQETCIWRTK